MVDASAIDAVQDSRAKVCDAAGTCCSAKPDASQKPNFLQVSVALSDSTHLHKNSSIHIQKPI
jgi:hypothetical protein